MKLLKDFSKGELAHFQHGQRVMTDMLRRFDAVCRAHHIPYWCTGGTLIGAMLYKGWIPHDGDVDVCVLESDYGRLRAALQAALPAAYWVQDSQIDKQYREWPTCSIAKVRYLHAHYIDDAVHRWHNGIQLDIFLFRRGKGGEIVSCHPFTLPGGVENTWPRETIFPLGALPFEGIQVCVPNAYMKYCTRLLGKPPRILPPQECAPHEGRIHFSIPQWMKDMYPSLYKRRR